MPTIHITKTNVEKIEQPKTGRVDYFDDTLKGFGVRVSPTCKTYFTMRRVNGKLTRTKIDTADKITAEQARKRAESDLVDMGKGINPNEVKRQAVKETEEAKKQAITLQEVMESYLDKRALKPRSVSTIKSLFKLYLSDWLSISIHEITKQMISDRHALIAKGTRTRDVIKRAGEEIPLRKAAADNCLRALRTVLNFYQGDDESFLNPVRILSRRREWYKVDGRRTLIKNSDLPAWFKAVDGLDNSIMKDYLIFLLFTGLRRQEAATLKWKQIDFQEASFTIIDTKNKSPHTLPLSDYLYKLLTDRKEGLKTELAEAKAVMLNIELMNLRQQQTARNRLALAESRLASPYVFPGEGKTGFINEPRRAINAVTESTGIVFSCHDLRRTFATIAESLDLSRYSVKALLNHKQQASDVTGGYIILNVDRLREPMQKITTALLERIKTPYGRVISIQTAEV